MIIFQVMQANLLNSILLPSDAFYVIQKNREYKHTFLINAFEQDKGHYPFQWLYISNLNIV